MCSSGKKTGPVGNRLEKSEMSSAPLERKPGQLAVDSKILKMLSAPASSLILEKDALWARSPRRALLYLDAEMARDTGRDTCASLTIFLVCFYSQFLSLYLISFLSTGLIRIRKTRVDESRQA